MKSLKSLKTNMCHFSTKLVVRTNRSVLTNESNDLFEITIFYQITFLVRQSI